MRSHREEELCKRIDRTRTKKQAMAKDSTAEDPLDILSRKKLPCQRALAAAERIAQKVERGEMGAEDDSCGDDSGICDYCKMPEVDGNELLQCCTGLDYPSCCGKLFHLRCVSLQSLPDAEWMCQGCVNAQLGFFGVTHCVGICGREIVFADEPEQQDVTSEDSQSQEQEVDPDAGNEANNKQQEDKQDVTSEDSQSQEQEVDPDVGNEAKDVQKEDEQTEQTEDHR